MNFIIKYSSTYLIVGIEKECMECGFFTRLETQALAEKIDINACS